MIYLILTVSISLFICFYCTLLDAVFRTVPGTLLEQLAKGNPGAAKLLDLRLHHKDRVLVSTQALNMLGLTFGAALAGAESVVLWGNSAFIFAVVLTLLILSMSQALPKALGTTHAAAMAGFAGNALARLVRVMRPVTTFSSMLGRTVVFDDVVPDNQVDVTASEIRALVTMAADQGAITTQQHRILTNFLRFDKVTVTDVMTPRPVITMMPATATIHDLMVAEEVTSFSRIPIYGEDCDDVQGYVVVRQVWEAAARDGDRERQLSTFKRQVNVMPQTYSVGEALRSLTAKREHLALVIDEYGGIKGLITLEDLMETILGVEIMDETDKVADMRKLAMQIRDERLARINASRGNTAH